MGIRFLLALAAVAGIMWYLSWYNRASDDKKKQSLRTALLYGIGAALLILVVTGRIPWLFALFTAAVPWINRALIAKSIWSKLRNPQHSDDAVNRGDRDKAAPPRPIDSMTREEAFDILGLDYDADRDAIIDAHRKLISRVHPDKGGTDYLASSINQARDVLLENSGNA